MTAAALTAAAPASAGGTDVVKGKLSALAAGVDRGYEISGPVRLQRRADSTTVRLNVRGLQGRTTYMAHLHEAPCEQSGGGHYQDDPEGGTTPPNELWLTIETNPSGNGHAGSTEHWAVRDGDRSVVIHDAEDGAKIACADLPLG